MGVVNTVCSCVPGEKKFWIFKHKSIISLKVWNTCSSSNQRLLFCPFWSNILHLCAEETEHYYAVYCKWVYIFIFFQIERVLLWMLSSLCNNQAFCVDVLALALQIFLIYHCFKRMWRNHFINIKCNKK